MRRMPAETRATRRRSIEEIKDDILNKLWKSEEKDVKLRRTDIANEVKINYITAVKLTDELENEQIIQRDTRGIYELTETGRNIIEEKTIPTRKRTEIIKLARKIAYTSPLDKSTKQCVFCGGKIVYGGNTGHKQKCSWNELAMIFEDGE